MDVPGLVDDAGREPAQRLRHDAVPPLLAQVALVERVAAPAVQLVVRLGECAGLAEAGLHAVDAGLHAHRQVALAVRVLSPALQPVFVPFYREVAVGPRRHQVWLEHLQSECLCRVNQD